MIEQSSKFHLWSPKVNLLLQSTVMINNTIQYTFFTLFGINLNRYYLKRYCINKWRIHVQMSRCSQTDGIAIQSVKCGKYLQKLDYLSSADPEGGTRGPDPPPPPPPGKSQVIWVSIGNKKLDTPLPLENVGPPLEPWKMIEFFENDHLTSIK